MYIVIFRKQPLRFLYEINEPDKTYLKNAISELSENYFIPGKNTKVLKGELATLFRLRIGKYRIIYTVDHPKNEVIILVINRRDSVY